MKYTFEAEPQKLTHLNPKEGIVVLPNSSDIGYSFTKNNAIKLTIDDWYFTAQDIEDLKELLTAFQNQLKKQS